MKSLLIALLLNGLNSVSTDRLTNVMAPTPSDTATRSDVSPDTRQVWQAVITFLTWYKDHMGEVSRFALVNQTPGKPYSMNLKNGERYLTYLKSSHRLTDAYLNQWRIYFKERQAGFRQSPQYEGPPTGFDYDLVMLNQDVDMQLASLKILKMGRVVVSNDKATVGFTLQDTYEFRLVRQKGRWLINKILNQSQE